MNHSLNPTSSKRLIAIATSLIVIFSLVLAPSPKNTHLTSFIIQGKNVDEVERIVESYGGDITSRLEIISGVAANLSPGIAPRLLTESGITSIKANSTVNLAKKSGNDPTPETDYPDVVGADLVWEQGTIGTGISVAILDTGLSQEPSIFKGIDSHPHDRILAWVDFVDGYNSPHDPYGHGTHVAGIIANSQTGSDDEWNGVAPDVNLVGVRVLDEQGIGSYERVIQGIQWVLEHRDEYNIKVINLSLVSQASSPYWADPLDQAVMKAWAEGITVVVAAGNDGPGAMTIGVPGNTPYVITVGAFTDNYTPYNWNDDYLTPFSAAGPTLDGFVKPDLIAPGAHIVSTMLPGTNLVKDHQANRVNSHYFSMAGTSQATAVVSGIAALMLSHDSNLTPDEVKYRLMYTAFPWLDLDTTDALYSMWQQGAGRVNAHDAVYSETSGTANAGMDIWSDISGDQHYEGFSYYDEELGEFRLKGIFNDWAGGYGNWAGNYDNKAGGYGNWAGGYGNWAGGYGNWAGGYGNWAGGYGNWAGGYGNWAGGYGNWAGGYGNWAGGYGNWAGGYGNWAGSYGDASFAENFANWQDTFSNWAGTIQWIGTWIDFDD